MEITPREKRRHAAEREKNESLSAACRLFSRGVIFTRARVSLALLSLRKSGELLVVYEPFFFPTTFLEIDVSRSEDWDLVYQTLSANRFGTMFDLCEGLVAVLCYWLLLTLY